MRTVAVLMTGLLLTGGALAEEDPPDVRNSQVDVYFAEQADALTPQLPWNAETQQAHAAWRVEFDAKLRELLGHMPEKTPLQVEWDDAEVLETDLFTRRKVYIQSEEHYWVPAYYFVPKSVQGKTPAIVCLHGHSGILPYIREGTDAQKEKGASHELDYAVHFAEQGYITLAVVQRGWNETRADKPHSCNRVTMDSFLIGATPVGLRSWDAMRCIDFLQTRDEVDGTRIGAAGLSGGGTTTLFLTAIDERVRAGIVAGYYCTFRDSIFAIHHCICNCVPHIMEWGEMSDVAALIAPRPLLIISGDEDSIFPIEATRRAFTQLAETYTVLDARDNLESDFFSGEHQWSNRKTLPFLEQHLGTP
ncbi:MAG: alpha/beta hydrolase [Candidatus Hydrogenedentota bacterium]